MIWKDIQPSDTYEVYLSGLLQPEHYRLLTLLYQPLIGALSSALFHHLSYEPSMNRLRSEPTMHYSLLDTLQVPLSELMLARNRLEATGLVKVFEKKDEEKRHFLYHLHAPLQAKDFFEEPILSVPLYRKVGQTRFQTLKSLLTDQAPIRKDWQEVTRSYDDVFSVDVSRTILDPVFQHVSSLEKEQRFVTEAQKGSVHLTDHHIDIDLLRAGLKGNLVSEKAVTPQVLRHVQKLGFLYGIDTLSMKEEILHSVTEDGVIDIETLSKNVKEWYRFNHKKSEPAMVEKVQKPTNRTVETQPMTPEENHIRYLETVSPRELLQAHAGGGTPTPEDLSLIAEVMESQKLEPGVMNTLIEFVLYRTNMKLNRNFLIKIASHWARKQIKTVPEAMNLAREEQKKYQEWAMQKKDTTSKQPRRSKAPIREEKLPEWLKEYNEQKTSPAEHVVISNEELERKKQLEERLKKYKK